MQELILLLKAEPYVVKKRYLKLLTKFRREGEMHLMELEDSKQEQKQFTNVIDARNETIKEFSRRHDENVYLIKVMRKKIGNDFSIAHIDTMTDTVFLEKHIQTEYPANHVSIQAHGFNQREIGF